jgi:hypothetical protein
MAISLLLAAVSATTAFATPKHTEVLPFTENVNINRGETQLTHVQRPSTATVGYGVQIRKSPDLTLATDTITVRGCNRAVLHLLLFAGATSITISKNSKMVHHCRAAPLRLPATGWSTPFTALSQRDCLCLCANADTHAPTCNRIVRSCWCRRQRAT